MQTPAQMCGNGTCGEHYHADDPIFKKKEAMQQSNSDSERQTSNSSLEPEKKEEAKVELYNDPDDHGFRRIIRNFTPSYVCHHRAEPVGYEGSPIADSDDLFATDGS